MNGLNSGIDFACSLSLFIHFFHPSFLMFSHSASGNSWSWLYVLDLEKHEKRKDVWSVSGKEFSL